MVHSSSQHAELAQEVLQPLQDEDSSFSMIVRDAGRFQRMGSLKSSKTDVIIVIIIGYVHGSRGLRLKVSTGLRFQRCTV